MTEEMKMKSLLKTLRANRELFDVPQPDAGFEKRILHKLRASPRFKPSMLERSSSYLSSLLFFNSQVTMWRLAGGAFAVALVVVGIRISNIQTTPSQLNVAKQDVTNPLIASIVQRGGAKALDAWVKINGDLAESDPSTAAVTEKDQKRILAELEKKWAPAL